MRSEEIISATDSTRAIRPPSHKRVARPKTRRSRARIALLLVLVVVLGLLGFSYYVFHGIQSAQSSNRSSYLFVVRPGDTPDSVAVRLEKDGLIHDWLLLSGADLFKIDAKMEGLASNLVPGTFRLRRNMSIDEMIALLNAANPNEIQFTVLPGTRIGQIGHELRAVGLRGNDFLRVARHPHLGVGFRVGWPRHHTLEGFLYPDTYRVAPNSTGKDLVRVMLAQFAREFSPRLRAEAKREHKSVYRIVTMASIVEREDFIPSQKPTIASVYYNRLRLARGANGGVGKLLQSDPTVSYALGHPGNWWPPTPQDRRSVHSRYNTYIHYGLPPGPISNPVISSIRAALHPTHNPPHDRYYYMVTRPGDTSGRLYFAHTYRQFCAITRRC